MIAVFKKELSSYFNGMIGYVAVAVTLIMSGIFIKIVSFDNGIPMMEYALPSVSMILLLAVPIVTMSSFAGEKQSKTDQLLYSLPITSGQIVAGKYFAMVTVFALPTLILGIIPIILSMYGSINMFSTYSSLFIFFLLSCAMVSISMFMSAITESQITAAVLAAGVLAAMYFSAALTSIIPTTEIASLISFAVIALLLSAVVYAFVKDIYIAGAVLVVLEVAVALTYYFDSSIFLGLIQRAVSAVSLFDRFDVTVRSQMLDLNTVVYYVSVSFLFAFLTSQAVEKRRYN